MQTERTTITRNRTAYVDGREVTHLGGNLFYHCDCTKPDRPRADFVVVDWPAEDLARVGREGGTVYTLHRGRADWLCSCKAGERGLMCYHKRVMRGIEILFAPTPEERGRYLLDLLREAIEKETGRRLPR